jgi:hypothetical protein
MDDDHATERPRNDLDGLREEFGDRWEFTALWQTAASGPDRRQIFAVRTWDEKTLSAHDAAAMAAAIRREEGS